MTGTCTEQLTGGRTKILYYNTTGLWLTLYIGKRNAGGSGPKANIKCMPQQSKVTENAIMETTQSY